MENIQNLDLIISILIFILYLFIQCIKLIIKHKLTKKNNQNKLIEEKILQLILEAETLFENGIIKKEFVIESINKYLNNNKIQYDISKIEQFVEEVIAFSKTINYNGDSNE